MQAVSEEEVRQVIYISKPTHFDHLVVDDILTKSRAKNPAAGITGNLIYHADLFLQMLEGPHSAVNELYEKILADNRHADVVKLRDASFNRRLTHASPPGHSGVTSEKCFVSDIMSSSVLESK